jgi:DNA-binding transcriptional regulator YiaG
MARRRPGEEGQSLPGQLQLTRQELEAWLVSAQDLTAEEIIHLRQRLGLTQRELARWLGISESAVSLWEAARRRPRGPAHRLLKLIAELSCPEERGGSSNSRQESR